LLNNKYERNSYFILGKKYGICNMDPMATVVFRPLPFILLLLMILPGTGCKTPKSQKSIKPNLKLPQKFSQKGQAVLPSKWWKHFGDKDLSTLITKSLKENPGLKATWAKLKQSIAVAKKIGATSFPTLMGGRSGGYGYGYNIDKGSGSGQESFTLSLTASYEVDLWGKNGALRRAASLDVAVTKELLMASALSLTGEIVSCWYNLTTMNNHITLLNNQLKLNETYLKSLTLRFKMGQGNSTEILQQRRMVQSIQASILKKSQELILEKTRLALLIGVLPSHLKIKTPTTLPSLPPIPKTGFPLDLIKRRPDVRSAWFSVKAEDARVAAAIVARLPKLSLSFGVTSTTEKFKDIFQNWLVNLVANIVAPIIDGGQLKAELQKSKAILEEKISRYKESVLKAVSDVESYLLREKLQKDYITNLDNQIELSKKVLKEILFKYRQGVTEFTIYLTTKMSLQNLELELISAKGSLIQIRVGLLRSLAGGFPLITPKSDTNNDN
jgi:outer membrane protein, multidrug efflux system